MEQKISEVIKGQGLHPQPTPPFRENETSISDWERCDPASIEVPQEAIDNFIRQYQMNESARINNVTYLKHINKPLEYPKYSAEQYYGLLEQKGLIVDEANQQIVEGLILYFAGDARFETAFDKPMSLSKGIMLMGNIGCGKTFLMTMFQNSLVGGHILKSCREVTSEYQEHGVAALKRYKELAKIASANPLNGTHLYGYCFDDLGTEEIRSNYGNKENVMEQIILSAYDQPSLKGRIHLTTNLDADGVNEKYGPRVRSRIREMFNIIAFPENAADRRK